MRGQSEADYLAAVAIFVIYKKKSSGIEARVATRRRCERRGIKFFGISRILFNKRARNPPGVSQKLTSNALFPS